MTARRKPSPDPRAPKHAWILNHYAAKPDDATAGARHYFLARGLMDDGWTCSIVAASTQHYTGLQRLRGPRLSETEDVDGVTFRWLRCPNYRGNGLLRVINMLVYAVGALSPVGTMGLRRPQVIIGSTVHPLAPLVAMMLARWHRVPFIYEIRDLWPETLIQVGAIQKNGLVAKIMRMTERRLCYAASAVITTMPNAVAYLEAQGVPRSKVRWISNGVDIDQFGEASPVRGGEDFRVTYFGAFGKINSLDTLIRGFVLATRDDDFAARAQLRIVGEGPERSGLERLAASVVGDVVIAGPVPRDQIPGIASDSDLLAVVLSPMGLYEYGISLNKLFEYMAAGRPVLCAGSAQGNPVAASNCGVVTSSDAAAISEALLQVFRASTNQRENWGRAGRRYVEEKFSYRLLSKRLTVILSEAIADADND